MFDFWFTSQVLVSEAFPEGGVTGEGLHNVMPHCDLCQVHQRLLQPHLQAHPNTTYLSTDTQTDSQTDRQTGTSR